MYLGVFVSVWADGENDPALDRHGDEAQCCQGQHQPPPPAATRRKLMSGDG